MRHIRRLIGLTVTAGGVVWLVARLGGPDEALEKLKPWWPVVLVALGIINLIGLVRRPAWLLAPLVLVAGGAAALLVTLDTNVPDPARPYLWPVVVTVVGATITLWERQRIEGGDQLLQLTVVLRTRRFLNTSTRFRHGIVRAFVGNLELDLQRCKLMQDAELCVTVVVGHVDLRPPPDCEVQLLKPFGLGVAVPSLPAPGPASGEGIPVLKVSVIGFLGGFDVRAMPNRAAMVVDDEPAETGMPSRPPTITVPAEPHP